MTRLLVVAASPVVRAGLVALLAPAGDVEVATAPELSADWGNPPPDAILVGLSSVADELPEDLAALAAEPGAPPLLVLVEGPSPAWLPEALAAGIRAVLPSESSPREIAAAVESAAAGLVVLHPGDLRALSLPRDRAPAAESLTAREVEVLRMLAEGLGNKEIAWKLGISEHTVKFHVGSILGKLNASTRTEAVMAGVRQGLVLL